MSAAGQALIPARPVLRWHGGKWRLAPWILRHFPPHRVYVEPFGGAASVLLRKPRAYAEVYNDLDDDVVNLMRVLRDPGLAASLVEMLRLTPFARAEFRAAYEPADNEVERARRLVVRSFMGFGSNAHALAGRGSSATGFRANCRRSRSTPSHDWARYPAALEAIIERLRGVVIECRDAPACITAHDGPDTLIYADPPYVPASRSAFQRGRGGGARGLYRHELSEADHAALLATLRRCAGMVVLSGYATPLYDEALSDWRRIETPAFADGARPRTEVLWLNRNCCRALDRSTGATLFETAEAAE